MEKEKEDAFPFGIYWLSVHQVATYSQQYIVCQAIQIDIWTLDQNTLKQHKQSVVNNLLEQARKLSSTAQDLNNELKCVKGILLLNGYPKWMIKNKQKKQHNRSPEFRSKVILPYSVDLGETLKRILERHRVRTIFKTIIKLSTVLASEKGAVPARKRWDIVYEIPCGNCEHRYIGETKRSLILDWKNTIGTPYLELFLKIQVKQR